MKNNVFQKKWKNRFVEKMLYVIKIFTALAISIFHSRRFKNTKVWLIGLGDDIYANNGKSFYEYLVAKHPEIKLFWVCEAASREALSKYIPENRLITRGTVNNYSFAIVAEVAVYGFSDYDVAPGFYRIVKKHKTCVVNISHGYDGLKGMPKDYYTNLPADIICAASAYEQKMKIEHCGADASKVILTGFARYDDWPIDDSSDKSIKNILIMPTWRDWYETEHIEWNKTPLAKEYTAIFDEFETIAEFKDINFVFYFHPRMQAFYSDAKWRNYKHIKAADSEKSFKELLLDADCLITDYSSVLWDAIYMKKSTILFWFDENEYRSQRGLMVNSNFYPYVAHNNNELISMIDSLLKNDSSYKAFCTEDQQYFKWRDHENCNRIFQAIQSRLR